MLQTLLDAASCGLLCWVAARTYNRCVGLAAGLVYGFYGIAIFYTGLILDTTVAIFLQLAFISLFMLGLDRSFGEPRPVPASMASPASESSPSRPPGKASYSFGPLFFVLSGFTFGLLITARPNFILFLPFLLPFAFLFLRGGVRWSQRPPVKRVVWIFGRWPKRQKHDSASLVARETACTARGLKTRNHPLKILALFGAGAAIVLSAASWRHAVHFSTLSPFPAHGGFNFYIGNNPQAKGIFMSPPGVSRSPGTQIKDSIWLASRQSGRDLTPYEASRYWLAQGLDYLTDQPLDAAALWMKKAALFFRKEEISTNIDYAQSKQLVPLFGIPFFGFGLIAPLCLIGVLLPLGTASDHARGYGAGRPEEGSGDPGREKGTAGHALLLFYFAAGTASIVLFFISDRYRLPMVPIAIIFAARAAVELVRSARSRNVKKFTALFLSSALLFFLVNYNFDGLAAKRSTGIHYIHLANTYIQQNKKEIALEHLKRAVAIDPGAAAAFASLGRLQVEMGDLEAGEGSLRKALAIDPLFAVAHLYLGIALEKRGDMEAAVRHYRTAIDISPSLVEARVKLARRLLAAGDPAAAHAQYQAALAEDPDFEPAYEGFGELLAKSGDLEAAVRVFNQIVARNPVSYAAHVNAGLALKKAGQIDAAALHFRRAADLDPKRFEALLRLGSIHSARGERAQAMALFGKALEAAPESHEAHLKVGVEYAKRGEMGSAVEAFRRAVALRPESEEARRNLVRAYLASGDPAAARNEYEELLKKIPAAAKPLERYFPDGPRP